MAQADEAMEMMTCMRCGRFSGPEVLCARCEGEQDEEDRTMPRHGQHPSNRLSSGAVHDFTQALELVEDEHAYERGLLVDAGAAPEIVHRTDAGQAQVFAAVASARRVWFEEQEAARVRAIDRLRADALAAEAALDDEASRWLGLLAEALEAGDYSRLAI